jgi:hypothetical protein
MKTLKQFKEDYQIGEDLAHAEKRYHQSRQIYNKRASDASRANPNTTRTSPEEHERLSAKAGKSFELNKQKTQKLQVAMAADRAANPLSQSEKDRIERNARGYGQNRNMGD